MKLLPSATTSAIIRPKTSVISADKLVPSSSNKKVEGQEKTVVIKEKLTTIAGLLEGTLASKKKEETDKKKKEQQERRGAREAKLEKKPKDTGGKLDLPKVPGMSFLDRIKQFIMNVLGGYLLYKLVEFAPLLTPILTGIMQVGEWLINFGGTLLNGLVTFIDWGYKAYDWTRGQVENIFGEEGAKKFDDFAGLVNKLLNGVLIGAMVAIKVAQAARKAALKNGGRGGTRPTIKPGQGFRPKVTTTGGRGLNRPDVRNPFRQKPNITGSGSGPLSGLKNPLRQKPNITGSGGGGILSKLNPKSLVSGAKTLGVGLVLESAGNFVIDYSFDRIFGTREEQNQNFAEKAKTKSLEELQAKIDELLKAYKKETEYQKSLLGTLDKIAALGGTTTSDIKLQVITDKLNALGITPSQPADDTSPAEIEPKKLLSENEYYNERVLNDSLPSTYEEYKSEFEGDQTKPSKVSPTVKIQGRQEGGQIKPLDTPKKAAEKPNYVKGRQNISQIKVDQKSKMFDTAQTFSKIDFFGPILASATKIMSGEDLAPIDYKSIGAGFNNLLLKGFQDGKLKSNLAIAYNDGGIVSADSLKDGPLASANFSQWVGDTFKEEYIKQKPKLKQSTKGKEKKKTDGKQKTAAQSIEDALKSMLGISDPEPEPGSTDGPGSIATVRDPATGVPMTSAGQASGAVQSDGELVSSMGFSAEDWNLFRNTVAQIESGGTYDIAGGSGDHYDGRYQLGAAAKTDGARYAGVVDPGHGPGAREAFRKDAELQEKLFAGFTKANHSYLMRVPEYKDSTPQRKLQILGYAHNQGMGGAENWMKTGVVGADGFGTKGTKYTDSIAAEFRKKSQKMQFGGEVDGQQGIDKVPAMLTSGEFVMDKDSTMAIQTAFPGFLSAVNKAEGQKAVEILMNYASYNDPTSGEVVVIDRKEVIAQAPMQTPSTVRPAPSGSSINFKEILSFVG
jgi:hypothetical protein